MVKPGTVWRRFPDLVNSWGLTLRGNPRIVPGFHRGEIFSLRGMPYAIRLCLPTRPGNVRSKNCMKPPNSDTPILLDAIDRRILASLQENGRMTNVDLSKRAGISAPPCLRRVRALEEAGVIRGYHADTDPQKLGWEITFFAIVGLESQKEAVLSAFEQLVGSWAEVRECHMIRGGGDFLLKLVARDTAHENQLTQKLTGSPAVSRVQTLQTIRTSRSLAGVPFT
jgi:DNA-binding Lrp family transcriptional regulator